MWVSSSSSSSSSYGLFLFSLWKKIYEFLQTTKETTKTQTQTNIKNQETQRPREKHQQTPTKHQQTQRPNHRTRVLCKFKTPFLTQFLISLSLTLNLPLTLSLSILVFNLTHSLAHYNLQNQNLHVSFACICSGDGGSTDNFYYSVDTPWNFDRVLFKDLNFRCIINPGSTTHFRAKFFHITPQTPIILLVEPKSSSDTN